MTGYLTQFGITLHIDNFLKTSRHIREIHTKAAGKVNQRPLPLGGVGGGSEAIYHLYLIFRRLFTGTLLHGKMGWINNAVSSRPLWQLGACRLPSTYLVKCPSYIHILCLGTFQCQLADIPFTVLPYKIYRFLISHRLQR